MKLINKIILAIRQKPKNRFSLTCDLESTGDKLYSLQLFKTKFVKLIYTFTPDWEGLLCHEIKSLHLVSADLTVLYSNFG